MSLSPVALRVVDRVRRSLWVLLALAVALLVGWKRVWSPVRVEVVRVDRATVVQTAFGRGTIESQREAAVGFDLVGRLSEVLVDEGTRVTLGQELARLQTEQAQADLRSAQRGVSVARASLQRLSADEQRARTLLRTAERENARADSLFRTGALAGLQRDEASDRLGLAQAELNRVLAQRSEATRGIDVAAGGAEQRRVTMVRATLLAPFDGLITRRLREPGDTVTVGSAVLRIVDTRQVYVQAAIDETVLPLLAVDQPCSITFPGETDPVPGRLTRIPWEADRQTHELVVEVTPDRSARRIAIGQRADVRIEVRRSDNTLRIPTRMIFHDAQGPFVYADRGGRIAVLRPRFGITGAEHVEVRGGLAEGDALLAAPSPALSLPPGRRWSTR